MKSAKKPLSILLAAAIAANSTFSASAAGFWQYEPPNWYHITDEKRDVGWYSENQDVWYFLGPDGIMQTGWYQDSNGNRYYLNQAHEGTEGQMRYGWYLDQQGFWYYLSTEHNGVFGKALTGWAWIDGYCYCFDENGKMYAGCTTPDGYQVDPSGRWILDGIPQFIEGLGYKSSHTHETASSFIPGGGGSGSGGGSGGNSGNQSGGNSNPDGVYESSNKKTFSSTEKVKAFDNTSQNGQNELELLDSTTLASWISELPEVNGEDIASDNPRDIELVVSNDNPFYQYIENGQIEEGDVIYIPASEDRLVPMTLVYQSHDDDYSGEGLFDPNATEVLHVQEATLPLLIANEIDYSAGGVNPSNPLAFEWSFQYPGTESASTASTYALATPSEMIDEEDPTATSSEMFEDDTATISELVRKKATPSEMTRKAHIQRTVPNIASASKAGNPFHVTMDQNKNTGKITLDISGNCIIYDGDGNTSTTSDQIKLSGNYKVKDIYPQVEIDWPILEHFTLDFSPNQLMAKISCEDEMKLSLNYSTEVADFREIVKSINKANMAHANEYDLIFFKIQGIDFNNSAVLWAGGINVGTGTVHTSMESLQYGSLLVPFSPTIVIMLLLDVDGNITAKVSADIDKESYRELGVNYQKKSYVGAGGSVDDNKGEVNIDMGNHMLNVYAKDWRSKTDSRPSGYTVTLEADGDANVDTSLNLGVGLMMAGLIPTAAKAGVGINTEMEGNGKIVISPDTVSSQLDGHAALDLYTKAQLLAKLNIVGLDVSKEWRWSLFSKEVDGSDATPINFNAELEKYFTDSYEELSRKLLLKSSEETSDGLCEISSFVDDLSINNPEFSSVLENGSIWVNYIRPTANITDGVSLIYEHSSGARKNAGVTDLYCGISQLFTGLNENTTFNDLLVQTGITGEYWADGFDSDIPAFIFQHNGYEYWLDFYALENPNGYDWTTEDGLNEIESLLKKQKVLDSQIQIHITPPLCKNINVYENVLLNGGTRHATCSVPSGDLWQNVISGRYCTIYSHGAHTLSFEFQAEPLSGNDILEISYGNSFQTFNITPGTNKIVFSADENTNSSAFGITLRGPETFYIRNAILDPQ